MNFTVVRKAVAGKKAVVVSITIIIVMASTWLAAGLGIPDETENTVAVRSDNAHNNPFAENSIVKQEKRAERPFPELLPETGSEAEVKFANQLIIDYGRKKNIAVSASEQTLLVQNLLQLRDLSLKTKTNLEQGQELNSSEDQLKSFRNLMEGESSFKKILGITLSEFIGSLSDEQVMTFVPENFQEQKSRHDIAAHRLKFPW
jgi:hypothetical protein